MVGRCLTVFRGGTALCRAWGITTSQKRFSGVAAGTQAGAALFGGGSFRTRSRSEVRFNGQLVGGLSARAPGQLHTAPDALCRATQLAATRRSYAAPVDEPLRMRVKAEVSDFSRLSGGVLARARRRLRTDLDAVGDGAVNSAVKVLALANVFAEQEFSTGVGFLPELTVDGDHAGGNKLVRLVVQARPTATHALDDFSSGGIFVPVDSSAIGSRGQGGRTREGRGGEEAGGARERAGATRAATPTELARTVLGQWLLFAAPELRAAARAAAKDRAMGGAGVAASKADAPTPRRAKAPFLIAMGPPADCEPRREGPRLRVRGHAEGALGWSAFAGCGSTF
eukprot:CAMPEP_0117460016 /NCGR_PEP_ID=MMETSP0784-20121206/1780_1 /TAXON_ID=39447 /ORGANISM="" /LENGTH=339 /DNA_ID=CAMNT_0005253655 /DNA_START=64 /DNA_END=1080 /DNA_ORIENTATION=-